MKKHRILSGLLALVLTLSILAVPGAAAGTPSSWAQESVSIAISKGLVPTALQDQYTAPITRREFCLLADALYTVVKGSAAPQTATFTDTTDPAVLRMASVQVVNGVGNGAFNPNGQLNREQAATMLARLAAALGKPLADSAPTFADSGSVSGWAKAAVGQMQKSGVMGGVGNNLFSPAGSYTREQSIATILRVYNLVNGETASGTHAGTRSDPLDASKGANVTYNDYSFYPTRQVSFKVLNTITGEGANYLATKTSSYNDKPTSGQEWLFFEVEFKYLSSTGSEEDELSPSSVLTSFYKADGSSMNAADTASISDNALSSYRSSNMYPGATAKVLVGLLVNKGYDKVLLRVPNNSDSENETNTWVHMNAGGSTISTVDAVNAHFGLEGSGATTDPDGPGSRSNPLSGSAGATVNYYYSSETTRQVKLKVLNRITGSGANYLATKTSRINDKPASGQEWLFFEVECSYVSSSAGSDDSFSPSSLFNSNNFFMPDGNAMSIASGASIYDSAFSEYNKEMYPGATSKILVGKLVDGGYGKVLLRIESGSDAYTWVHLNDGGSTIRTVSAVNSHFGLTGSTTGTGSDTKSEPTGVTLSRSSLTLEQGDSAKLTVTVRPSGVDDTVVWTSTNSSVAAVSDGRVTAVSAGTATITVSTSNGKTARCTVTVTEPESDPDPDTETETPEEYLSFLKFGQEYGPITMKNYHDVSLDPADDKTNSVTSFVFTGAGEYKPLTSTFPVTVHIKGTSEEDSIAFWFRTYFDGDDTHYGEHHVYCKEGITAGQPYDVTLTVELRFPAQEGSLWYIPGSESLSPSHVTKIGLMGGTGNQTEEYIYFDTNGNRIQS